MIFKNPVTSVIGLLKVLWEDGSQGKVKYGVDGIYDVVLDDREPTDEKLRIGTVVERGEFVFH